MDSLATLTTVLEHAQSERDKALTAMRQAEASARAARQQIEQLHSYRGEYRERWAARFRESGPVELLHCYQGFAGRLDQAITLQTQTTAQAEQRLQRARDLLLAKEQRVAAVSKLIERRQAELLRTAQRREQRQTDETAARVGQARRMTNDHF